MLYYDSVDACALKSDPHIAMPGRWHVVEYGAGSSVPEESFVASATTFSESIVPASAYPLVSDTSSGVSLPVLQTPRFMNHTLSRSLVYCMHGPSAEDLKRINCSEAPKLQPIAEERFEKAFQRIGQFAKLPSNWDSYGGNAIDERCMDRALEILKYLIRLEDRIKVPTPFVAPLSTGGIQIEWEEGDKYLEIELAPQFLEIGYSAGDGAPAGSLHLEGSISSVSSLKDLLVWFVTGTAEDLGCLSFENTYENLAA